MSISRLYNFTPNTTIASAEVDAEFDQLVAEVNKMLKKDGSEDMTGDLTIAKSNPAYIMDGSETSAQGFRMRSDGGDVDFDIYDSAWYTIFQLDQANKVTRIPDPYSLEGDGTNELLIDQDDIGVIFGSGSQAAAYGLVINVGADDAYLRLNDSDGSHYWDILMDASDGNDFHIMYDGSTLIEIDSDTGGLQLHGDDATSPVANRLFKANIPKAWAYLSCGLAGVVTVDNDHNIASASWSGDSMTVNIDTNMADVNYAIGVLANRTTAEALVSFDAVGQAAGSFVLNKKEAPTGVADDWNAIDKVGVTIHGDQ